ncbi:DUF1707 and DUF4870 domain-containing protein [Streptomonospora nanhaiensis]|uniref:Putative Tic20 family protein n=1 Tax=Streptomonospora nanhaiensis TaxID=1323731 RepID=A0A853BNH1_9ACTN|nr:DUF1707 and DUF4870 domain-containing protein [Streptomonospora nanhaiensis]MBV2366985.1 DUF1707 and DUF4870 domain-containing protein [Streptomonospora nanhaiensis]MBX9390144.1 DUF1707 and DUF4870 domain-containing protein [Streptomonospora nanhaiensis]NYI97169.1 putative Tic20 family protein [Streptomonospora nanhaiensis]
MRLTHADRDSAMEALREAYALGQLDEAELEERLDLALKAKFPADLQPLLADVVPQQRGARGWPPRPGAAGPEPEVSSNPSERLLASVAHFSGYASVFGPLLMLLVARDTAPYVRRHILEALNYQITVMAGSVVLLMLSWLILPAVAFVFLVLGWVFLPAVAAIATLAQGTWRYPLTWRPVRDS